MRSNTETPRPVIIAGVPHWSDNNLPLSPEEARAWRRDLARQQSRVAVQQHASRSARGIGLVGIALLSWAGQ